MKTVFIDANAFLRLLLNDVPEQVKEFEKFLKQAKDSKIKAVVPQIVIFEINFTLEKYYGYSKEAIVKGLQYIIETPYILIAERDIFRNSLKLYSEFNLSLVDCFIYSSAKEKDAGLFTFDKDLLKLQKGQNL